MLQIPFRDTFLRKLGYFSDLSETVDSRDALDSSPGGVISGTGIAYFAWFSQGGSET